MPLRWPVSPRVRMVTTECSFFSTTGYARRRPSIRPSTLWPRWWSAATSSECQPHDRRRSRDRDLGRRELLDPGLDLLAAARHDTDRSALAGGVQRHRAGGLRRCTGLAPVPGTAWRLDLTALQWTASAHVSVWAQESAERGPGIGVGCDAVEADPVVDGQSGACVALVVRL